MTTVPTEPRTGRSAFRRRTASAAGGGTSRRRVGQRALLEPECDAVPGGGLARVTGRHGGVPVGLAGPDTSLLFLIETLAGEPAGACSLEGPRARARTASLGIWIDEEHWNEGLGTDAVRTLCRFGFREMNLRRIALHVYDFNERGISAYEKVGFREEGRLRKRPVRRRAPRRRRGHGPARGTSSWNRTGKRPGGCGGSRPAAPPSCGEGSRGAGAGFRPPAAGGVHPPSRKSCVSGELATTLRRR